MALVDSLGPNGRGFVEEEDVVTLVKRTDVVLTPEMMTEAFEEPPVKKATKKKTSK